jgi:hypothetical protein
MGGIIQNPKRNFFKEDLAVKLIDWRVPKPWL